MELAAPSPSIKITVEDQSQISEARRLTKRLAAETLFEEIQIENAAIVVTELATNLVKHAEKGEIIIRPLVQNGSAGIEIISVDRGRGVENIESAMADGNSTAGTLGAGLGAAKRLSQFFDIISAPDVGTIAISRIKAKRDAVEVTNQFSVGSVCLPIEGETACGDNWMSFQSTDRCLVMVADGLGHGPLAAEASTEALRIFAENSERNPAVILELATDALKKTRGAAVAVAEINTQKRAVAFAGVGNISATITEGGIQRSLISMNGTVGIGRNRAREYYYPWTDKSTLIMASDGIVSNWKLDRFAGLALRDPSFTSAVLYKFCSRGRDDVTAVTVTQNS